jgi:hypothetical protein
MADVQNTGNPVLDTFANLAMAYADRASLDSLRELHKIVLELAAKEPCGLRYLLSEKDRAIQLLDSPKPD